MGTSDSGVGFQGSGYGLRCLRIQGIERNACLDAGTVYDRKTKSQDPNICRIGYCQDDSRSSMAYGICVTRLQLLSEGSDARPTRLIAVQENLV